MLINFISSKDSDETRNMPTKSNDIETMIGDEFFKSLLQIYQEGSEESMKGSELVFDRDNLLYYHLQKTSLKRTGSSYIDSPEWLKNKKSNNKSKK